MKNDNSICLEDKKIILKTSQTEDISGIQKKLDMSIPVYNDKITSNISMITNDNHNFTKHINEEIKCTNKIRYTILMNFMCCLIKVCKKKEDEDSKKKKKKEDEDEYSKKRKDEDEDEDEDSKKKKEDEDEDSKKKNKK